MAPKRYILRTVSTHKRFSDNRFRKTFLALTVCKVCAQIALLHSVYKGSCSEAVFALFAPLGGLCVVFYADLTLAGKEMAWNLR